MIFRYCMMIVKIKVTISIFFFLTITLGDLSGQEFYFDYNTECRQIYEQIIDLKLNSARQGILEMSQNDAQNLARLHLENYIDFFDIFINEDYENFKKLEKNKDQRIKQLKEQLKESDPYRNFSIAEINLQWALARSKFDQLFKAGREVYSAYNLLKENSEKHPDFIYNKKSLSIIHSLIETITLPGLFKKIFGIDGSIELGISEIKDVIDYSNEKDFIFIEEADAIYAFILFYQKNDQKEALEFILQSRLNPNKSLLSNFLIVKLLQRSGYNEKALEILSLRPRGKEYDHFYYLDFLEGLCLLRQLDKKAIDKFRFYIENFKGRHYIKEAYQKLAWSELIFEEDLPAYKFFMSQVGSKGYALLDDDKQANKEFLSKAVPDPILLKARILYDGGYYEKAYRLLTKNAYLYHTKGHYTLEFNYRIGRICQALKNYPDAIIYFNNTVNNGYYEDGFYACNAALQLGKIYESLGNEKMANKHYKQCIKIIPTEYKNSLHQKAKTGLERLKK